MVKCEFSVVSAITTGEPQRPHSDMHRHWPPNGLPLRRPPQGSPADAEALRPVLGFPILLEAEEFAPLRGILRVVGHDVHPLVVLFTPPLEASASGNAIWVCKL
jgi:hypothetical protein